MSLQTFLSTVETDLTEGVQWVEGETETALADIWGIVKPVFTTFAPTLVQGVLTGVVTFLTTASADLKGGDAADIEEAFLMALEAEGSTLLADAQSLGSDVLQALIGLTKAKLAAA